MINRRRFIESAGGGLLALTNASALGAAAGKLRFAVIADTHIIDDFYKGPEGSPEDTESILKSSERLKMTRTTINSLRPAMERVFVVGDYFHNYPSADVDFFFQHKTRIDNARELTDGFSMPAHVGFGNHDYDVPKVSREATHELFRRKLGLKPYYSLEHKGFKFIHLNNFLGVTWQAGHDRYERGKGSLGEEQLNWFEAELKQRQPTFVFIHYPLQLIATKERKDYDLLVLLKQHKETVQRVISGHWHRWFEFGRSFGPQHLVIAATRYDPNAFLVVEADERKATHELLNIDLVDWNTHYSRPWRA
ncbi:MAG: metallophosphoesterase [Acidobacteria bacterium]|nr:metallophosphoesterase [Acidobacteriota bacterium]